MPFSFKKVVGAKAWGSLGMGVAPLRPMYKKATIKKRAYITIKTIFKVLEFCCPFSLELK